MPTKIGNIWASWSGHYSANSASYTATVNPQNRDITAESALTFLNHSSNSGVYARTGIWRIVSNGQLEEFTPLLPFIQRDNVTQIVFRLESSYGRASARHTINYWN